MINQLDLNSVIRHVIVTSAWLASSLAIADEQPPPQVLKILNALPSLSPSEANRLAEKYFESDKSPDRVVAAIAIRKMNDSKLAKKILSVLLEDTDVSVVRLTWLNGKWSLIDGRERASKSSDPFVRAIAALKTSNVGTLESLCYDRSPFVRALAIRRLSRRSDQGAPSFRQQLNRCLVDHDDLVRSNAIVCAKLGRYLPVELASGLLMDTRPMVTVESFIAPDSDQTAKLEEMGLPGLSSPEFGLFRREQLLATGPVIDLTYNELLLPIGEKATIGATVAALFLQVDEGRARLEITKIIKRQANTLAKQLEVALEQKSSRN